MEAKHVNEFKPDEVLWEKISKGLLRNPDRPLKNTNKRMVYIYNNMFFVKKDFTFGFRTVKSFSGVEPIPICLGGALSHLIRCSIIEWCWNPTRRTRSRKGTHYILLTVQKTVFGLDIIPETIFLQLIENGFNMGDFGKMKRYDQKAYKLPPPTPAHVPAETNKRPLEEQPGLSSKRKEFLSHLSHQTICGSCVDRQTFSTTLVSSQPVIIPEFPVQIPPVQIPVTPELTTPPVQIPDPPVKRPVFEPPVQISDPPVQIQMTPEPTIPQPPVQLILPNPPVVQTLEPTRYGRQFNRSDHVVRIWRLLATRDSSTPVSYSRNPRA
ncbi:uncharacterized protein TNCV_768651 [Trichonephila clavipes]|nr:uncharacterized protein TNCV_768651 [Trichonephila clavipes]